MKPIEEVSCSVAQRRSCRIDSSLYPQHEPKSPSTGGDAPAYWVISCNLNNMIGELTVCEVYFYCSCWQVVA